MPLDHQEREAIAQQRRDELYQQRAVAAYYDGLSNKRLSLNLAPRHPELFADAYRSPQLPEEKDAGSQPIAKPESLAQQAKEIIDRKSLPLLKELLGPASPQSHEYARKSRENHWEWLKTYFQLRLVNLKEKYLLNRSNRPESINDLLVKDLNLDPKIKAITTAYLRKLVEGNPLIKPSKNTAADLYALKEMRERLVKTCEDIEARQVKLNNTRQSMIDNTEDVWREFQARLERDLFRDGASMSQEVSQLKKDGIASKSLETCLIEGQTSLVDYAIQSYKNASLADKGKLLEIIEYLLMRGSKPLNDAHIQDWAVTNLIIKYADTITQDKEDVRKQLMVYSEEAQQPLPWLMSIIPAFIYDPRISQEWTRKAVACYAVTLTLKSSAELFNIIAKDKAVAPAGFWQSTTVFYAQLTWVEAQSARGQLLAAPAQKRSQADYPKSPATPAESEGTELASTNVNTYGS